MSITEVVFVALGIMLSVVAFFLKRESMKIDRLQKKSRGYGNRIS